jgi:hypothetical protein
MKINPSRAATIADATKIIRDRFCILRAMLIAARINKRLGE